MSAVFSHTRSSLTSRREGRPRQRGDGICCWVVSGVQRHKRAASGRVQRVAIVVVAAEGAPRHRHPAVQGIVTAVGRRVLSGSGRRKSYRLEWRSSLSTVKAFCDGSGPSPIAQPIGRQPDGFICSPPCRKGIRVERDGVSEGSCSASGRLPCRVSAAAPRFAECVIERCTCAPDARMRFGSAVVMMSCGAHQAGLAWVRPTATAGAQAA